MTKPKVYKNESDVKKAVKKLLDKYEWFWWMPPSNAFGRTGISDFNAVKKGNFMAIETKFGANTPTAMQQAFLNSIAAEDSFAFVVCEKRVDWLEGWLQAFETASKHASRFERAPDEVGAELINATRELIKGY